eukprot:g7168.t1
MGGHACRHLPRSFSHDSADFLGKLKFPTGEEAQELRQECTNIASKVINAEEVSDLGSCSERIWVHRPIKASQGRWQECCASENGLKCMDRFVIPANSCESCQGVCLDIGGKEGYCLELGSPGSWEGSGRAGQRSAGDPGSLFWRNVDQHDVHSGLNDIQQIKRAL